MGKFNFRDYDEDDYLEIEYNEKIQRRKNKNKGRNEDDFFESQGKSGRGRKGDSYITQRTKGRSRS